MSSEPVPRYGTNGDPLPDGKLDLPELLETPVPDEMDWAREFIGCREWREAVTYREKAPHEYTVRKWEVGDRANEGFDQFTTFIRRFGRAGLFHGLRHLYWVVDAHSYWTMGWPVDQTTVINRERVDPPKLQEGG